MVLESVKGGVDTLCFDGRVLPSSPRCDLLFETRYCSFKAKKACRKTFDEFSVEIPLPLDDGELIGFFLAFGGRKYPIEVKSGKFCSVTFLRFDWVRIGNVVLCSAGKRRDCVKVKRALLLDLMLRELFFQVNTIVGKRGACIALSCRRGLFLEKCGFRKRSNSIWLISDRPAMGGDNGEALFCYLSSHPIEGVDVFFVLNADSPDYGRLSKKGHVIPFGSMEHIRLQSQAEFVISSAADEFVINRFGSFRYLLKSAGQARFIFLQHGVTKDDMSGWLNRWNKNIRLFFTASEREKKSIVGNSSYGYTDREVKLTGFPRHDDLLRLKGKCPSEKKILIAPTWRSNIAGKTIQSKGTRSENPEFELTDYYQFYQALINDSAFISTAKKLGYSLVFLIHPAFAQEAHKFTSDYVQIRDSYDYRHEFLTSAILLTDYSSVAFDFALLEKPIVYCQCDSDKFYEQHSWERGYFRYEEDGFGEVTRTLEETVDALVSYMQNPEMPILYKGRVESFFFAPSEGSRCELVTDFILDCHVDGKSR